MPPRAARNDARLNPRTPRARRALANFARDLATFSPHHGGLRRLPGHGRRGQPQRESGIAKAAEFDIRANMIV